MPNDKNTNLVKALREKVVGAKAIIFTEYSGLDANNINALRDSMKNSDAEIVVAKNTLVKLAMQTEKKDTKAFEQDLKGPVATIFAHTDGIATIKALVEFIKKVELPKIKAALFEGVYTTAEQVELISKLPSKQELLTKLVYTLKSPISRLVGSLHTSQQKFVYTLSAIAEQKKGGAN